MQIIPALVPYEEDELFFSWFYRLSIHNYALDLNNFANSYLHCGKFSDTRHPRRVKYDFRENLYKFKKAAILSDKKFYQIFLDISVFSAIAPFMNEFAKQLYLELALGDIKREDEEVLLSSLSTITDSIQFCPECMKEEKKQCGFFWYHRAHQLPGVKVCHKHHCALKMFTGIRGKEFTEFAYSKTTIEEIEDIDIRYAQFCKDFMDARINTDIYAIKKIILNCCRKLQYDEEYYKVLDEKIAKSQYEKIFDQNASIYVNRKEMDGTYIDTNMGLPLLFFLFKDVDTIQNELSFIQEGNINEPVEEFNTTIEKMAKINQYSKSKYILNQYNASTKEVMEKEIKDLVGNEYEMIGDYTDRVTKIQLLHKKCGHTFNIKPMTFLNGGRCHYCNRMMTEDAFERIVKELSQERYILRGRATKNLWIIHDTYSFKDILLTKQKTLQELNRKSDSDILPLQGKSISSDELIITKNDVVYNWICKEYTKDSPIFLEDINIEGLTYAEIKSLMRGVIKQGNLVRIVPGIYSFPEANISQEELLKSSYLLRNGKHIGFYYGRTFGTRLGLCELPDTQYIATNKESQRHGRKKQVFGQRVRIKGTVSEITDENYQILAMLDFITCFNTYTKEGKEKVQKKIKSYIKDCGLKKEEVKQYIDLFPVWTKYFLGGIWGEGWSM